MDDVLDKIRKALAMTTSSSEAEARTAAMIAANLIRQHGVALGFGAVGGSASAAQLEQARREGFARGVSSMSGTRTDDYRRGFEEGRAQRDARTTSASHAEHYQRGVRDGRAAAERIDSAAQYQRGYTAGYEQGRRDARAARPTDFRAKAEPREGSAAEPAASKEANFSAYCVVCGAWYAAGERIWWRRGKGGAHLECADATFGS